MTNDPDKPPPPEPEPQPDPVAVAGVIVTDAVDLSLVALGALNPDEDTILARAIARLLRDAARPDEAIAGFNSSL